MKITNYLRSRNESSYQAFIPTKSGILSMSVVAGDGLYSSPREKIKNTEDYTKLEVAFFNSETNDWASYNELIKAFPIIGEGEYMYQGEEEAKEPQNAVFGYVEIEKLNQVWEIL